MIKKEKELWITNTSTTQDICISDLNIVVRHGCSINLLAKKKNGYSRYGISKEQIDNSIEQGSIFKKGHILKIRKVDPVFFNHRIDVVQGENTERSLATRIKRKKEEIESVEFEEIDFKESSEEEFANEIADLDFSDNAPLIAVDKKFKPTNE